MPDVPQSGDFWEFEGAIGRLCGGKISASVDASRPQLGLQNVRVRSQSLEGAFLAVRPSDVSAWHAALAERYVRGGDLVASYAPSVDWPYAPQIYWRAEPTGNSQGVLAAVSLLVSIQTNLLDTHPVVHSVSQLPA